MTVLATLLIKALLTASSVKLQLCCWVEKHLPLLGRCVPSRGHYVPTSWPPRLLEGLPLSGLLTVSKASLPLAGLLLEDDQPHPLHHPHPTQTSSS